MNNEHHSLNCVLCVDSFIGFSKGYFSSVENKNINCCLPLAILNSARIRKFKI